MVVVVQQSSGVNIAIVACGLHNYGFTTTISSGQGYDGETCDSIKDETKMKHEYCSGWLKTRRNEAADV